MPEITFRHDKLRGKIVEVFGSVSAFSKEMGISEVAMSKFLNGKNDWNRKRIIEAAEKLKVSDDKEFHDLFFCR